MIDPNGSRGKATTKSFDLAPFCTSTSTQVSQKPVDLRRALGTLVSRNLSHRRLTVVGDSLIAFARRTSSITESRLLTRLRDILTARLRGG